ncbi:MAG TPA: hypothetical protein VGC01_12110 [Mucilaginibacter sp.]
MRIAILIIFCTISITASAQFWQKKEKPAPIVRSEQLPDAFYISTIPVIEKVEITPNFSDVSFKRSTYDIELAEDAVMKEAKHNMRFRIYNLASYNFSDLAALYILQNRFSEAKWYLLQSNNISRGQNDDKHTISNLINLAIIKSAIGELALAKVDLQEAHDLANAKGFQTDIVEIEKRMHDLQLVKSTSPKAELRYAEAVELSNKELKQ